MAKIIRKIGQTIRTKFHGNSAWWLNFSSAFVGTLLGIVLTFGITAFINFKNKQATAQQITLYTMRTISRNIYRNTNKLKEFEVRDSINKIVLEKYENNDLENLSLEDATAFASQLYQLNLIADNRSTESIFMSDIDIWSNVDNAKVIEVVGESFDAMRLIDKTAEELNHFFNDLYANFYRKKAKYSALSPEQKSRIVIKEILDDTDVYLRFSVHYPMKISMMKMSLQLLNFQFEWLKMRLNITDSDIENAFSDSSFDQSLESF